MRLIKVSNFAQLVVMVRYPGEEIPLRIWHGEEWVSKDRPGIYESRDLVHFVVLDEGQMEKMENRSTTVFNFFNHIVHIETGETLAHWLRESRQAAQDHALEPENSWELLQIVTSTASIGASSEPVSAD